MVQKAQIINIIAWLVLWAVPAPAAEFFPRQMVLGRLPCLSADSRAEGLRQLAWEAVKRTSLELAPEPRPVDLESADLFETPLVLGSGEGRAPELSAAARERLRHFISQGGMLWIDDPQAGPGGDFSASVRPQIENLLPERRFEPIGPEHVIYKSFFLVSRPSGRRADWRPEGILLEGRLAVLWTGGDLLGALSRDLLGGWRFNCEPGGERQREESFRLAINILMYAVCLDYKDDRVHLPFILRRRRL